MAIITKTAGQTNLNPTSTTAANRTSDTDDLIIINTASALAASNTINGGDGTDEIRVGGTGAAGTFNLGANVTNIENVVIGSGNVPGLGNAVVTNANHNVNASLVASALNIVGNNGNNIINGGSGNDTINGGAGNDTLNGNAGADSIVGGLGNDIINGGAGTDTLQGGDGNDTFIVTKGADTTIFERIQGGDGADLIRFSSATVNDTLSLGNQVTGIESIALGATAASTVALNVSASLVDNALTITGNAAANRITATAYDDTITGGAGNDTIAAGNGDDIITGGAGRDSLVGGNGNDTYLYTTAADFAAGESITDTDGFDVIRHTGTGTISLNNLVDGIEAVEIGTSISSTNAGGVNASAVENSLSIYGNNGANTLIGTAYGDYIIGAAGNDNISGNDGNDFIVGGAGIDTLKGGAGFDYIIGDSADSIDGGLDYDRLYVQANYTQANNARLTGVEEVGIYGAGNININLTGQTESFYIYGNDDNNSITGGSGNDVIYGRDGNDSLVGGAGNDVMYGGDEDGKIDGGVGVDTLVVGDSDYAFVAGADASLVRIENVEIDYDLDYAFLDLSTQSEGFNILGSYGDDTIIGGAGADNVDAGYGNDTIAITSVASYAVGDTINGGYGYDTILVDVGAEDADATIQLANVTDIERVVIEGDVNINVDASQVEMQSSIAWRGRPGNGLEIVGNDGDNYIVGTSGDDEITGYGGNDILDAGDGFDIANFRGHMSDYVITENDYVFTFRDVNGNDGTDTLFNFEEFNFDGNKYSAGDLNVVDDLTPDLDDLDNDNYVYGGSSDEFAELGAGNDYAYGGYGNDYFLGGSGNDTLDGGYGSDRLDGGAGDDTIVGGYGSDTIFGGAGDDYIKYDIDYDGQDSIDGGDGIDTVEIDSYNNQVRISFVSGEVGNGNTQNASGPNPGTPYEGEESGGLAVRVQAEDFMGDLTGNIGRVDDEGVRFEADGGFTFDVRDFATGAQRGDHFNEVILGTSGADTFDESGEEAHYYVNGGQGDDVITTSYGDDFLVGGAGNDTLSGSYGDDSFIGGSGNDVINGGYGDDIITGPQVTNPIYNLATDGADSINGGEGLDTVNLGATDATQIRLTFTSSAVGNDNANVTVDGGLAVFAQAEDSVTGGLTGTIARVDDEGVIFEAAPGVTFDVRDLVSGAERGDQFNTVILGTAEGEYLDADYLGALVTNNYYINGGMGNDSIYGAQGNDFLVGGADNDYLIGNDGNDSFIGGSGNDTIYGGEGKDTVVAYNLATDGEDFIDGGNGEDTVNVSSTGATQIRLTFTSADVGNGDAYDGFNAVNEDGGLAVRIQAENGADSTVGGIGRADDEGVTFVAGSGTTFDVRDLGGAARGDQFNVVTLGTNADDYFDDSDESNYYINGGAGNDTVFGGSGNDFLVGGADNDYLGGNAGNDSFIGGSGNDTIYGGEGDDSIDGGAGFDVAHVNSVINAEDISVVDGKFVVDADYQGTDTYVNTEQLETAEGTVLFVGNGGYATIQEAIDAASEGDIIAIGEGEFSGDIVVNKANLTIIGAQQGVAGSERTTGGLDDETVIYGRINITASGVTLDGLKQVFDAGHPINNVSSSEGIRIGAADVTVTNTVVLRSGGVLGDVVAGIRVQGAGAEVTDNYIANPGALTGGFSGAQVGFSQGVYGDVAASGDMVVEGNLVHNVRTAFSVDYITDDTVVDGNQVTATGSGVSVGIVGDADFDFTNNINNNDFDLAPGGTTYNFQNVTSGVTFNGAEAGNTGSVTLAVNGQPVDFQQNFLGSNNVVTGDNFTGTESADYMNGRAGNDTFTGGLGNDYIAGGDGDDVVVAYNLATGGADSIDGGNGLDVVNVSSTGATQIRISFVSAEVGNASANNATAATAGDYSGEAAGGLAVRLQAEDGSGALTGTIGRADDEGVTFVAAVGTTFDVRDFSNGAARGDQFNEVTLGSSAGDFFNNSGEPINHYINAGAGNDTVIGGAGNDFLVGGADNDELIGGNGNDSFIGGAGSDSVFGGANDDTVVDGGAGTDYLYGQLGNDVLNGGADNDYIYGGDDSDTLDGGAGGDYLYGEAGADVINVGASDGAADYVYQNAGDSLAAVTRTDLSPVDAINNGDSFTLAGDIVNQFVAGEDTFVFNFAVTQDGAYDGTIANNSFAIVHGSYVGDVFTVSDTGLDTAVFYDADTSGGVSQHSVVFTNSLLTIDDITTSFI